MTIRFGLLGAARIGTVHARAVSSNARAELIAVADAMPDAASALAGQYGAQVRTIDAKSPLISTSSGSRPVSALSMRRVLR